MVIPARAVPQVKVLAADWTQAQAIWTAQDPLRLREQQIVMQCLTDINHMSLVPIAFLIEAGIGSNQSWPVSLIDSSSQFAGHWDEAAGAELGQGGM